MMRFFLLLYVAHIVQTIYQADGKKVILKDGADPCEGHVEVFHKDQWGYVGDAKWNNETAETVCRSTHCGHLETQQDVLRIMSRTVWLNEIECRNDSDDLLKCAYPGWNNSYYPKDSVKKIKCSKRIKISLTPFKCAGAVVYNSSEGDKGCFCGNLGSDEANLLCQSLGCGDFKEIPEDEWIVLENSRTLSNMSIECSGTTNLDNLWQCATANAACTKPVSVICKGHKRLQITREENNTNACSGRLQEATEKDSKWTPVTSCQNARDTLLLDANCTDLCKQMHCGEGRIPLEPDNNDINLKCKDEVKVVLMDKGKPSKCYGEVHFEVNGKSNAVCGSSWTKNDAEVVCRELKCGGVLDHQPKSIIKQGIMDNVKCWGTESSLWHCMAKRGDINSPFSCSSRAYVVCANSINARLADGPGECAGRVELWYEGQWHGITKQTDENADAVCKHLKCGNQRKTAKSEKYVQGSGDTLDLSCETSASDISECKITASKNFDRRETKEAVGITCEEHKVVFLKGNASCSGAVGIEHADKTYWLSGSTKTWNENSANAVCRQMHCGEALNHTYIPSADMMKDVLPKSYNCLSNSKSLFQCENTIQYNTSDYNNTVAFVTCSGNTTVNLTEKCWGYVNVCSGGQCSGVCNATWTDEMSQTLCENLKCGKPMTGLKHKLEQSKVIFTSLHKTKHMNDLSQCNLVKNEDGITCEKAFAVCTGSVKANINVTGYRSKCSGNVEMFLGGRWLPVCKDALNAGAQNIICKELECGQPLKVVEYFGQRAAAPSVISKIECPTNNDLSECSITPGTSSCTLGHLQCSSWHHMDLKFGKACSGTVFVHSEGNTSAVSAEGWTESASNQLCKDLECGELKSNKTYDRETPLWSRTFNCDNLGKHEIENIWDCENKNSHTKPSQKRVEIECQGEPKVTLSAKCHGEVRINNISVCDSNWKPQYANLVCQQQSCGNAVPDDNKQSNALTKEVNSYHVNCEEYHHNLGQCNRYEAKCKNPVHVFCSDAVKFNTTEKCGGYIKVMFEKKLEFLCPPEQFSANMKKKLCDDLGCGGHNDSIKENNKKAEINIPVQLHCTEDTKDIKRCVSKKTCKAKPTMIYCDKYDNQTVDQTIKEPPNRTVPIILGTGFLLIVVILIIVFIRIRMVRKAKSPLYVPRMLPGNEVESESGEYEHVTNKENEMDVFSNGRFRSEAEVIMESDARSASSYDDVDEAAEAQPLTSPATPAGASGDSFFGDGALNQSSDGVTYEVEDPQESYDDIEASPELIQTEAEVHDVPEPAPESITMATPGMVQGDEDYLVPGQDR